MAKSSMTVSVGDSVKLGSNYSKTGKVVGQADKTRVVVAWDNGTRETLRPLYLVVTAFAQ